MSTDDLSLVWTQGAVIIARCLAVPCDKAFQILWNQMQLPLDRLWYLNSNSFPITQLQGRQGPSCADPSSSTGAEVQALDRSSGKQYSPT